MSYGLFWVAVLGATFHFRMVNYRILAFAWLVFGFGGSLLTGLECWRLFREGDAVSGGPVLSTLIGLAFCALSAATGFRLLQPKRWSRIVTAVLASLLIFYCLTFLAMVGLRFGLLAFFASLVGLILGFYSLVVIWVLKPRGTQPL